MFPSNVSTLHILLHIVFWGAWDTTAKPAQEMYDVCNSPVCLERAKLLNASMDRNADPCDDFYTYACGDWKSSHEIPKYEGFYNNFGVLRESLMKTLKDILEQIPLDYVRHQNFTQKAAVFYSACVAAEGNNAIEELKEKMKASGCSDWPITSGNTSYEHWSDVLLKTGMSPVLELRVGRDHFKITDQIIQVDEPGFPFAGRQQLIYPDDHFNAPIIGRYKNLIEVAAKLMKSDISDEDSSKLAEEIVEFEGSLANLRFSFLQQSAIVQG